MENPTSYEQALERLNEIVEGIEQGTVDIDHLAAMVKKAQALIAFCQSKLEAVENDIKNTLEDGKE